MFLWFYPLLLRDYDNTQRMSIKVRACQAQCKYKTLYLNSTAGVCSAWARTFLFKVKWTLFCGAVDSFSVFYLSLWSLCTRWNGHRDRKSWILWFCSSKHAAMKVILLCGNDYIWMKSDFFWESEKKRATGRLDLFFFSSKTKHWVTFPSVLLGLQAVVLYFKQKPPLFFTWIAKIAF